MRTEERPVGAQGHSQITASKERRASVVQPQRTEFHQQPELGSGFFPRASRNKHRPADTLILAIKFMKIIMAATEN